jgi:hypothetical protein
MAGNELPLCTFFFSPVHGVFHRGFSPAPAPKSPPSQKIAAEKWTRLVHFISPPKKYFSAPILFSRFALRRAARRKRQQSVYNFLA